MCDSYGTVQQLADWAEAYRRCATSEEFDDFVTRPSSLVVPLVCLRFSEKDGYPYDCNRFDLALPSSATVGEIREAMDSLPVAGGREMHVVSRLARRYRESRVLCHVGQEEVRAQEFHNRSCREVVLVEGQRWVCGLPIAYSHSSEAARVKIEEGDSLRIVIDMLLGERRLHSSCFVIPREAVVAELRDLCEGGWR